ncbi:MAG: bifunctional metallophosphatase/5'-nucleotidase [Myxococcales bacterium]|nr:bifunctional metallophosphatase/5'-nucleotidase [Myxococcales bacterium]
MRTQPRRGTIAVLFLALGVSAGCTKTPSELPNLAGQDVHLTVIHTSDLHSRIFPYQFSPGQIDKGLGLLPTHGNIAVVGGAARMATVIQRERAASSRVIHLDSGDIFQGAPVFNQFAGEVEMRVMTQLGLSAMVLGNHEFDKGTTNLALMKSRFAGFPILAANYTFADPDDPTQPKLRKVIAPFAIFNAGGLRVGVIGMGNHSSLNSLVEGGNSLGLRKLETKQVIADTKRLLRPVVDLLVIVSHMGLEEDEVAAQTNMNAANAADENDAARSSGIDVIFGGHLHIALNPPKDLPNYDADGKPDGHTIICHSGAFGKYVGRLDLVVHVADGEGATVDDRRSYVKSHTYKLIPIDDSIPPDPAMTKMLEPYQIKMNLALNLTQNYAVVPCALDQATCPKVRRTDPDGGDSQLGNLVATSMRLRRRVEADFGMTNSLGIRADFESGALNLEQMYNVFPFENTITTMFLSGNEIRDTLDFIANRSSERGCNSQSQVSGLWFMMDCNQRIACGPYDAAAIQEIAQTGKAPVRASQCHKDDRSLDGPPLLGDNCLKHPEGCKLVLPNGEYRAAVNDYIANGGSGFDVLKRNTTKFNTGISLRDSLIDYIRSIPKRCTASDNSNIVYDAQAIQEEVRACDPAKSPSEIDRVCGPGHVCKPDPAKPGDPGSYCLRHYDYSGLPCLDFDVEAHEERIVHNQ